MNNDITSVLTLAGIAFILTLIGVVLLNTGPKLGWKPYRRVLLSMMLHGTWLNDLEDDSEKRTAKMR